MRCSPKTTKPPNVRRFVPVTQKTISICWGDNGGQHEKSARHIFCTYFLSLLEATVLSRSLPHEAPTARFEMVCMCENFFCVTCVIQEWLYTHLLFTATIQKTLAERSVFFALFLLPLAGEISSLIHT